MIPYYTNFQILTFCQVVVPLNNYLSKKAGPLCVTSQRANLKSRVCKRRKGWDVFAQYGIFEQQIEVLFLIEILTLNFFVMQFYCWSELHCLAGACVPDMETKQELYKSHNSLNWVASAKLKKVGKKKVYTLTFNCQTSHLCFHKRECDRFSTTKFSLQSNAHFLLPPVCCGGRLDWKKNNKKKKTCGGKPHICCLPQKRNCYTVTVWSLLEHRVCGCW